jgi:hypothetical protein
VSSLAGATLVTNWTDAQGDPLLVDPAAYNYDLQPLSPCIDAGTLPAMPPTEEYVQPLMLEGRGVAGSAIDLGADEFGGALVLPVGGDAGTAPPTMTKASGCGCSAPAEPPSFVLIAICAFSIGRARRGANRRACDRPS